MEHWNTDLDHFQQLFFSKLLYDKLHFLTLYRAFSDKKVLCGGSKSGLTQIWFVYEFSCYLMRACGSLFCEIVQKLRTLILRRDYFS